MEISSNMYSPLTAQNAAAEAMNSAASNAINKNYEKATDEELMNACKQFESYFIEQVYKEMINTIPEEEYSSQATSTLVDYYKEQMVREMATTTSEQSGMGIARMLYEQMKRSGEGAVTAAQLKEAEEGTGDAAEEAAGLAAAPVSASDADENE